MPTHALIVWDTQTGVVVRTFHTEKYGKIMFHGDQRTITLVSKNQDVYTYDILDSRGLYQGRTNLPDDSVLGANWTNGEILWFAMMSGSHKKPVIDIYELQPTSSLHVHSSFPLAQNMEPPINSSNFCFSPVSSHASFIIKGGVVVLDVQDSKLLLQTGLDYGYPRQPGQFSPDGCFFISGLFQNDIHIWQNTPTGYVPWSSLGPQVHPGWNQWSPTSTSILCLSENVLQLVHPGDCPSPPLPNKARSQDRFVHLVAYSTDGTYVATLRMSGGTVTVFDCVSGISWQFTNPEMEIKDIKIVDNTIFVVDDHRLVGWVLEADGIVDGTPSAWRVTVDEALTFGSSLKGPRLSHDCSQIAFIWHERLLLYDRKAQVADEGYIPRSPQDIVDFWYSPDGCQLWFAEITGEYSLVELEPGKDKIFVELARVDLEDGQIMVNHSSHGYHVREGSGWVTDSRGRKLLWLPPSWRCWMVNSWGYIWWNGVFLALLDSSHPEPIIIKFKI